MKKLILFFVLSLLTTLVFGQKTITDANFSSTIQTNKLVVIDFYATWCGPCKSMAPLIESLASEYAGRVVIGQLDVDENSADDENSVIYLPTIMFIKNNRIVYRHEGALPRETLAQLIETYK